MLRLTYKNRMDYDDVYVVTCLDPNLEGRLDFSNANIIVTKPDEPHVVLSVLIKGDLLRYDMDLTEENFNRYYDVVASFNEKRGCTKWTIPLDLSSKQADGDKTETVNEDEKKVDDYLDYVMPILRDTIKGAILQGINKTKNS